MKKCILFAGPIGCSKTPVATYLSWNLGLPVFNTDAIRTEVIEDTLEYVPEAEEYLRRRNVRIEKLIKSGKDFILDASIDRTWPDLKPKLEEVGYRVLLISFDLSIGFWRTISAAKDYQNSEEVFTKVYQDHEAFRKENQKIINLTITDVNFNDRLELSLRAVNSFLSNS